MCGSNDFSNWKKDQSNWMIVEQGIGRPPCFILPNAGSSILIIIHQFTRFLFLGSPSYLVPPHLANSMYTKMAFDLWKERRLKKLKHESLLIWKVPSCDCPFSDPKGLWVLGLSMQGSRCFQWSVRKCVLCTCVMWYVWIVRYENMNFALLYYWYDK